MRGCRHATRSLELQRIRVSDPMKTHSGRVNSKSDLLALVERESLAYFALLKITLKAC